jgi:hypothetical protein
MMWMGKRLSPRRGPDGFPAEYTECHESEVRQANRHEHSTAARGIHCGR